MAFVKREEGESIESVLKRFKEKVEQEKILQEYKKHTEYTNEKKKKRKKK